jgi:hypothetical protein
MGLRGCGGYHVGRIMLRRRSGADGVTTPNRLRRKLVIVSESTNRDFSAIHILSTVILHLTFYR